MGAFPAAAAAALAATAAVTASVLLCAAPAGAQASGTLKSAAPRRLPVGGTLHPYFDTNNRDYQAAAAREFNAITTTAYMALGPWRNEDEAINTAPHKEMVKWAADRGMRVHGHVLVYPYTNQRLGWYQSSALNGRREAVLKKYVDTMASASPNGVAVWDVVNEVMGSSEDIARGTNVDRWGLRTDFVEYRDIPDYVEKAFRWAKDKVGAGTKLIINDFNIEEVNAKSTALLEYVKHLRRRGVPIDGVGFQTHLDATGKGPNCKSMQENFARFAAAGLSLYVTELDVRAKITTNPADRPSAAQLRDQAKVYATVARLVVGQPAFKMLLLWEFADKRSWLHPTTDPSVGLRVGTYTFPTPYTGGDPGEQVVAKPAVEAMRTALRGDGRSPCSEAGSTQGGGGGGSSAPQSGSSVRIVSAWSPASGVLTRNSATGGGCGTPTSVGVSSGVGAPRWVLEAASGGQRLRSACPGSPLYLGRLGERVGGRWEQGTSVFLSALESRAENQQWTTAPCAGGGVSLTCQWGPSTCVLTRVGKQTGSGAFTPSDGVTLKSRNPAWDSQCWTIG